MNYLFVIPARGGSKGLPGKNIKALKGIPLIEYSLAYARLFVQDKDICVSTNDREIAAIATAAGYQMPFLRPENLATDNAGMFEVLRHALDHYEEQGRHYDALVLLQPTSPFRRKEFFEGARELFEPENDMVVSVSESKANPYFNLFEENAEGFLQLSKQSGVKARQEAPKVYQYNGNLYIINTKSLRLYESLAAFPRIVKYVMPMEYAIDIDTLADWNQAEYYLNNTIVKADGKLPANSPS